VDTRSHAHAAAARTHRDTHRQAHVRTSYGGIGIVAFADAYTTLGMSPSGIDWMVTSGASFWRFWSKNTFPNTYPQTGAGRD
jgi:hypothetical protein